MVTHKWLLRFKNFNIFKRKNGHYFFLYISINVSGLVRCRVEGLVYTYAVAIKDGIKCLVLSPRIFKK